MRGLAALRAVVEKGGVTEAAKALSIGQPAVTKRLRALEECYGMPLFKRVSGRLRMSEAGEKVYLLAVQTLERQLALREDLTNLAEGRTSMRLEATFAIGEHLLPDILFGFDERFPRYKVTSRLAYSRQMQANLATGLTDLALLEVAPDHPDILVQRWMDDELWLVCGPNHPLVGAELLPLEDLKELSFVMRERRSSVRESLEEALSGVGIDNLQVALEVGSTDAIIEILSRSRHVSFMPRFAVFDRVRRGGLFHIKTSGFRIRRTLWLARNRSKLDNPVVEAFIGMLREQPLAPVEGAA